MKFDEVVPAFLAACPGLVPAWQEHLAVWGGEDDRGFYNDVAVIAHHLVDRFGQGDLSEFPAAFALLERCLAEGDPPVREVATVGIIEDIQNVASHRPFGPQVFLDWLGPLSRSAWDEMCQFWQKVAIAKAAGILEPDLGPPPVPQPVLDAIQDAALRRMVEKMYRNGSDG
jgi:hypothetical protein